MDKPRLCSVCRSIDWKLLRLPTESETSLIQNYELPRRFPYITNSQVRQCKVDLGHLADLKLRTQCDLCSYISKYLESRNVYTEDGKSSAGGHLVRCRADLGRQAAIFRYPEVDSNDSVTIFKLSITTHLEGHPAHDVDNVAHLLLDNHFQTCNVGAGAIHVDEKFRDPRLGIDMALFGGRVRPQQLNIEWIKQWIEICEHEHNNLCNSLLSAPDASTLLMSHIRFIDVANKCVVTMHGADLANIRYAALSYVWGPSPAPGFTAHGARVHELNSSNIEALHQPQSLESTHMPQTIEDTLELAKLLSIAFVWIDRLCIVQDDIEDKASQLGKMHLIYNAAHITIIAAAGSDVYHGLPGLSSGSRSSDQQEIVVLEPCAPDCEQKHEHDMEGLSLLTCLEPFIRGSSYLEKANWSHRGWTMQERILARRSLVFTEQQVRFACANITFSEDTYSEFPYPRMQTFSKAEGDHGLRSSVRVYSESGDPETRLWGQFKALVLQYSTRLLTFGGDVHDAFAAITQALALEAGDEFLWGIPLSQFEIGLSWRTFDGQHRRTDLTTLPMTDKHRRVPFPSWSWMGWVGQTSIAVGRERTETEKPTIECYIHAPSGENGIKLDTIQHATVASQSWKPRNFPKHWTFHPDRTVSVEDVRKHLPDVTVERLRDIPSNHLLLFWTSSAKFRVSRPRSEVEGLLLRQPQLDFVCQQCYTVEQHMSGAKEPREKKSQVVQDHASNMLNESEQVVGTLSRMTSEFWKSGIYDNGIHEFIVLARRNIPELADFFPATLLVMQVERVDGIWYRVNMGEIAENDWNAAETKWKLIALG